MTPGGKCAIEKNKKTKSIQGGTKGLIKGRKDEEGIKGKERKSFLKPSYLSM